MSCLNCKYSKAHRVSYDKDKRILVCDNPKSKYYENGVALKGGECKEYKDGRTIKPV